VIGHDRLKAAVKPFVHTGKITDSIRKCMRAAGVRRRPYVLRAYAETQLIIAESKGKISHPYLQFVAGHKGDVEARYSTNKGRLPPDMIEDMREAYKRCEQFLCTAARPFEQASVIKEARIEAIKTVARTLFGVDIADVKIAHEREVGHEVTRDDEIKLYEEEIKRKRARVHGLLDVLFQDPEVRELTERKLRELRRAGKI